MSLPPFDAWCGIHDCPATVESPLGVTQWGALITAWVCETCADAEVCS
jgi:hypothetical protein